MKREGVSTVLPGPAAAHVELTLARVEGSAAFRTSRRHRELLRHLVERTLAGDVASLKESVLAVEVFGRHASTFDPRTDTIVRVETRRLRRRLDNYFRAEGRQSPIRIELPVGSYVPLIAVRDLPQRAEDVSRRARDLVERGDHFLRQPLSQTTLEQALDRFDAALRESPDHVPALVGAGRAWLNLATGWYVAPGAAAEHAGESLRRALALDDDHAVAHALLGAIQHTFERDWLAARRSFRRALERAPDSAFVHSAYGCHLMYREEADAAQEQLELARRLDPQYVNTRMHMVNLRLLQRRFDAAQAELDALTDIAPSNMAVAAQAGVIALCRGNAPAAVLHYERARQLAPTHRACRAALAAALGAAGRVDEADKIVRQLAPVDGEPPLSPYLLAIVEMHCGRHDRAFDLLGEALSLIDPNLVMLTSDPSFASLHGDSRWPSLVRAARTPRRP